MNKLLSAIAFIIFIGHHVGAQEARLMLPAGHTGAITSASFAPDGKKIITASSYNKDKTQNVPMDLSLVVVIDPNNYLPVAQSRIKHYLPVTQSRIRRRKAVAITDIPIPPPLPILVPAVDTTRAATLPVETKIATPLTDTVKANISPALDIKIQKRSFYSIVKIWDMQTWSLESKTKSKNKLYLKSASIVDKFGNIAYSPNGKKIAIISLDNTVKVSDKQTGSSQVVLKGHSGKINSAYFSPDGKKIVTASADNTAKIWDAQTGALLFSLEGHTDSVSSAKFSPNGLNILTASYDNTCKIWNAKTGKLLFTFLPVDSKDYIVTDPYGRYDGSTGARNLIYFICSDNGNIATKIKSRLWVPNLAEHILKGERITAKKLSQLHICGLKPIYRYRKRIKYDSGC